MSTAEIGRFGNAVFQTLYLCDWKFSPTSRETVVLPVACYSCKFIFGSPVLPLISVLSVSHVYCLGVRIPSVPCLCKECGPASHTQL